jgi:predicted flavoprotein YhiN
LTPKEIKAFADFCKNFSFEVNGTHPLDKAFVTGGGVSTKEINPKSMESKLTKGLYFCGELIDYNGYTGGYNITGAFVTGHTAGQHAAAGLHDITYPIQQRERSNLPMRQLRSLFSIL